jgi:hypothetical protein
MLHNEKKKKKPKNSYLFGYTSKPTMRKDVLSSSTLSLYHIRMLTWLLITQSLPCIEHGVEVVQKEKNHSTRQATATGNRVDPRTHGAGSEEEAGFILVRLCLVFLVSVHGCTWQVVQNPKGRKKEDGGKGRAENTKSASLRQNVDHSVECQFATMRCRIRGEMDGMRLVGYDGMKLTSRLCARSG